MLSIGEFSKICQVSVKTLHHYDKLGLLVPAQVDAESGYRYYETAQLDRMLLISRLKRYGFSLEDVRRLIDCGDPKMLRQQAQRLQSRQEDLAQTVRALAAHLENFERTRDIMDHQKQYHVAITTAPRYGVLTSRQTMGVKDFGYHYGTIFERITQAKLTPNGVVGAAYYDEVFDPEASDIELFVGIVQAEAADKTIGGQRCVTTLHKGNYSALPDAYAAIVAWMENEGLAMAGAPFEIYRKDQFNSLSPEDWETEIYFPIEEQ